MVTATANSTNQARTVITARTASIAVPLLDPGSYRVRFSLPGFKTSEVIGRLIGGYRNRGSQPDAGSRRRRRTGDCRSHSRSDPDRDFDIGHHGRPEPRSRNLPLVSRNFTAVLGMSAGVAVAANNGNAFGKGTENMSVNGANPEKNNFQMDGVSINNAAGNNEANDDGLYTGIAIPNPDAIQEFKIQTSTYDASYGRNPGANVNVVTKGGGNEFHGSLFEFFRNEALNANDFFYNRDRRPGSPDKQILRQNQFGGIHRRASYEGQDLLLRQLSGNSAAQWRGCSRHNFGDPVSRSGQP